MVVGTAQFPVRASATKKEAFFAAAFAVSLRRAFDEVLRGVHADRRAAGLTCFAIACVVSPRFSAGSSP